MDNEKKKNIGLKDLINYDVETYVTEHDVQVLRDTFGRNPDLINIIRKIMLPTIGDSTMPVEEMMAQDPWNTGMDWSQVAVDEAKALIVARQHVIKFIMGGIIRIKSMSLQEVKENSVALALKNKQNSAK